MNGPLLVRSLFTGLLLLAIWRGSRLALIVVLGLQAIANEFVLWLLKRKGILK